MRARSLKPGFFVNEDLLELPFEYRLLFAGLWTVADREGRLEDRPKKIKLAVFPGDSVDVEAGLCALECKGFIQRYVVNTARFIQVLAWSKHQSPHVKEAPSVIPAREQHQTSTVPAPDKPGANTSVAALTPSSLTPDSGLLTPDCSHSVRVRRAAAQPIEPPEFIEIRQIFPKRSGSQRWGDALRHYRRRLSEGEPPDKILDGIRRYREFCAAMGIERTEHVQQAATFLGENRGYLEPWTLPAKAETPMERLRRLNSGERDARTFDAESSTALAAIGSDVRG